MLAQQRISADVIGLLTVFIERHSIEGQPIIDSLERCSADSSITYQQWWDALEALDGICQFEHIGLLLGQCIAPEFGGVLGFLGASSTTLGNAANHFERFQRLLFGGTGVEIQMDDDCIKGQWLPAYCSANKASDDTLISALVSFARMLTGDPTLAPSRIGFMHPRPSDTSSYRDIFLCDVQFDCSALFVEIPKALAFLDAKNGNPTLGVVLEQQAQFLLEAAPINDDGFIGEVRQRVINELHGGDPSQENIAAGLGVSSRTLHRRLAEAGTGFVCLLQDIRLMMAKDLLQHRTLSMSEIAFRLGYAEQSAFSRAFKQWSGETPLSYQKGQQ